MKNIQNVLSTSLLLLTVLFAGCDSSPKGTEAENANVEPAVSVASEDLPDWQYIGYKAVHHMALQVEQINQIGFNVFDNPPIADYQSFVITPALDHFYSSLEPEKPCDWGICY